MKACITCGTPLGKKNVKGYCRPHFSAARWAAVPKPAPRLCRCGAELSAKNKSGLCLKHMLEERNADPVEQAKQHAALKRRFATDPVLKEMHRERARGLHLLPQSREAKLRRYTPEFQRKGVDALRAMPEVRARAAAKMSATKLGWCPPHLRDEYRHLTQRKAFPAAEARQMIEDQHELAMARWRRSVGLEVEYSEFTPVEPSEADLTPLELATELVALRSQITVGKLFSDNRHAPLVRARSALALAMKREGHTLGQIAGAMHKADHTTAFNWVRKADYLVERDRQFAALVDELQACWHRLDQAA